MSVDPKRLNTVYIISKGRPQCLTAKTFERIGYPGDWFIVCGDNDETLDEYVSRWGSDRVLVFDWVDECSRTDFMDPFGYETKASGASPARNAARAFSFARGDVRHWQFDDDYTGFHRFYPEVGKNRTIFDGRMLYEIMLAIAEFAHRNGLSNAGFPSAEEEARPDGCARPSWRVFNAHNLPSSPDEFETWRGRMNDDLVNSIDVWRHGGREVNIKFVQMNMENTQSSEGGLTDLYKEDGTVRKTAYALIAAPGAVKLVEKFGRHHHRVNWKRLVPKMVHSRFAR